MNAQDSDFSYCPTLARLISSGKAELPDGSTVTVGGMSTINNLHVLRKLMLDERPESTLEVGLASGGSALIFLTTHKEIGSPSGVRHTAIDAFQREHCSNVGVQMIREAGFSVNFELVEQLSCFALADLLKQQRKFGIIYIDGSHVFPNVFIDFYYCSQLLAANGILLFDDCGDAHVRKVCSFIDRNLSAYLVAIDLAPYRADAGKSVKYRVGKLVGRLQLRAYRLVSALPEQWNFQFRNF
jgi:hypothetical protein